MPNNKFAGAAETEFSLVRFKGDAARAKAVYAGMSAMTAADIADNVAYVVTRHVFVLARKYAAPQPVLAARLRVPV